MEMGWMGTPHSAWPPHGKERCDGRGRERSAACRTCSKFRRTPGRAADTDALRAALRNEDAAEDAPVRLAEAPAAGDPAAQAHAERQREQFRRRVAANLVSLRKRQMDVREKMMALMWQYYHDVARLGKSNGAELRDKHATLMRQLYDLENSLQAEQNAYRDLERRWKDEEAVRQGTAPAGPDPGDFLAEFWESNPTGWKRRFKPNETPDELRNRELLHDIADVVRDAQVKGTRAAEKDRLEALRDLQFNVRDRIRTLVQRKTSEAVERIFAQLDPPAAEEEEKDGDKMKGHRAPVRVGRRVWMMREDRSGRRGPPHRGPSPGPAAHLPVPGDRGPARGPHGGGQPAGRRGLGPAPGRHADPGQPAGRRRTGRRRRRARRARRPARGAGRPGGPGHPAAGPVPAAPPARHGVAPVPVPGPARRRGGPARRLARARAPGPARTAAARLGAAMRHPIDRVLFGVALR